MDFTRKSKTKLNTISGQKGTPLATDDSKIFRVPPKYWLCTVKNFQQNCACTVLELYGGRVAQSEMHRYTRTRSEAHSPFSPEATSRTEHMMEQEEGKVQ